MAALELISRWPVDGAAAGVIQRTGRGTGKRSGDAGAGVVVLDEFGDVERPFAWASITKLLVATSVLVAVEEGALSFDEPAGPPGSTVRHLLSHASG
ncbi:MAG: serine hydrolase, partial [Acidimicrobiales bacterium]